MKSDLSELDTAELLLPTEETPSDLPAPFSSLVQLDFGAESHVGKVRATNEDAYLIFRTGRYWEKLMSNLPTGDLPERHEENGYVMAVADGMGGMAAGEVASRLALRTAVGLILNAVKWTLKLDHPEDRRAEIEEGIQRAVSYLRQMDQALADRAKTDPTLEGMGTTLTASYSFGDDLFIFHVGDSRAYLFRDGNLRCLTTDHTLAQALLEKGLISRADVPGHRFRHVLTQALGRGGSGLDVEIHQLKLLDGDAVLLCSDGLTNLVEDSILAETLGRKETAARLCRTLVDRALERGGRDNITALLARYRIPQRTGLR